MERPENVSSNAAGKGDFSTIEFPEDTVPVGMMNHGRLESLVLGGFINAIDVARE
jgi:hypothetical protein